MNRLKAVFVKSPVSLLFFLAAMCIFLTQTVSFDAGEQWYGFVESVMYVGAGLFLVWAVWGIYKFASKKPVEILGGTPNKVITIGGEVIFFYYAAASIFAKLSFWWTVPLCWAFFVFCAIYVLIYRSRHERIYYNDAYNTKMN